MPSDARIVRQDRVEIHRDKGGRMPNFVWMKERGVLLLIEEGGERTVVLVREGHPDLSDEISTVRGYGTPRGPYGSTAFGDRALRIGFGEERLIVAFTGETTDLTGTVADLQVDRLTGDFDLMSALGAARDLWRNRDFWRRSLEAAKAWRGLLPKGSGAAGRATNTRSKAKASPARAPATRGGGGMGVRYSDEFRQRAVAAAQASDASVAAVARELEISPTTLRRWIEQSA
ncbi:transposase [Agromyces sp. MMS24-K17]|uniref:transposase n=1 Tax=Agromyces sp. MMS24-K17 TaxID=3372850 RepID=UPI0037541C48